MGCLCSFHQVVFKFSQARNHPRHPHDQKEVTAMASVLLPSRERAPRQLGWYRYRVLWEQGLAPVAFYPFFSLVPHDYNLGPYVATVTNSPGTQTSGSWTSNHWDSGSEGSFTSQVYDSGVGSTSFTWVVPRAEHYREDNVCVRVCVCVCMRMYFYLPPATNQGITEKAALKSAIRWWADGHLNG